MNVVYFTNNLTLPLGIRYSWQKELGNDVLVGLRAITMLTFPSMSPLMKVHINNLEIYFFVAA
jgi:hypothetical protein